MVILNTTPFISLCSVNLLHLMPSIFGSIVVASSVQEECKEGGKIFVPNLETLPWVTVQPVQHKKQLPVLFELDRGERDTLIIAAEHVDSIVLMDEKPGRNMAEYLGFQVVGTLGILAKARKLGLIESFSGAARDMRQHGIFFSEALILRIADKLGESSLH
jgi:hypothetical protein